MDWSREELYYQAPLHKQRQGTYIQPLEDESFLVCFNPLTLFQRSATCEEWEKIILTEDFNGKLKCVAVMHDGVIMVVGADNASILIFNESRTLAHKLQTKYRDISGLCPLSDGGVIMNYARNKVSVVRKRSDGQWKVVKEFAGKHPYIRSVVQVSCGNVVLFSGCATGEVFRKYSGEDWQSVQMIHCGGHPSFLWYDFIVLPGDRGFMAHDNDSKLQIWDANFQHRWYLRTKLPTLGMRICSGICLRDGTILLSSRYDEVTLFRRKHETKEWLAVGRLGAYNVDFKFMVEWSGGFIAANENSNIIDVWERAKAIDDTEVWYVKCSLEASFRITSQLIVTENDSIIAYDDSQRMCIWTTSQTKCGRNCCSFMCILSILMD